MCYSLHIPGAAPHTQKGLSEQLLIYKLVRHDTDRDICHAPAREEGKDRIETFVSVYAS